MAKRIHIVGCSPRSGTTLLFELIVSCFDVEKLGDHEMSVFVAPPTQTAVYCSKNPQDIHVARPMLWLDGDLWIIHMMRDPRDVVVSRHARDPERYWCNLRAWKDRREPALKAEGHPRFLTIHYEDLVRDPDGVQQRLSAWAPFLERTAQFSSYERVATPSDRSLEALGELRPISTNRIGMWRRHKPRLVAQLEIHGSIANALIALGYEHDESWLRELDGVVADNGESHFPDRVFWPSRVMRAARRRVKLLKYAFRRASRRRQRT